MQVNLKLDVDPSDADESHSTGLTSEAFDRLTDALAQAGFEIADGPDRVKSE